LLPAALDDEAAKSEPVNTDDRVGFFQITLSPASRARKFCLGYFVRSPRFMFILPFLINYFLAFFATLKLKYRASQAHFSLRLISPLTLSVESI